MKETRIRTHTYSQLYFVPDLLYGNTVQRLSRQWNQPEERQGRSVPCHCFVLWLASLSERIRSPWLAPASFSSIWALRTPIHCCFGSLYAHFVMRCPTLCLKPSMVPRTVASITAPGTLPLWCQARRITGLDSWVPFVVGLTPHLKQRQESRAHPGC